MTQRPKPVVLAILDGWGEREAVENNAIAQAATPHWDRFKKEFPHALIEASESHVGLPAGQMGNSEVGHTNIGAGRVVMQDLPRIDAAIAGGELAKNPRLVKFISDMKRSGGTCHLMGLLSPGGVHSHMSHIAALAKIMADTGIEVKIHAFLDGRDTPPKSAVKYLTWFEKEIEGHAAIATVSGRYYAMDRDNRWDRVWAAYTMIVGASEKGSTHALTAFDAVKQSYEKDKNSDEFVIPTAIGSYTGMNDRDGVLMANFRSDRVREILTALLDPGFKEFNDFAPPYKRVKFAASLGMVEYSDHLNKFMPALFPPESLSHIFGEVVSTAGLSQLRIAETEKYAHVTFFFNGGREAVFPGEERILVPSPKVATYDLKPEMSAFEVTEKLVAAIAQEKFDVIVVNYANTDMVGHTGDMNAAKKAVETVDTCLGKLSEAVLLRGGALLITADHGNIEQLFDPATQQAHTAHTLNPVPVILLAEQFCNRNITLKNGRLADIAPTLLALLKLEQPAEMTGKSLLPDA